MPKRSRSGEVSRPARVVAPTSEQHVVGFEVGQQCGQVTGLVQHRAGRVAQVGAHLVGDDVRQGGLAQTRRAEDQGMVQGVPALPGSLDKNIHLFRYLRLSHVVLQALGTDRPVEDLVLFGARGRYQSVGFNHGPVVSTHVRFESSEPRIS